jgi:hypothetical protein
MTHWSDRRDYGPWYLDEETYVLWTVAGGYRYEVDLEDCLTAARVLDWICQINGKGWGVTRAAHDLIVAGLIEAISDLLYPQGRLCHGNSLTRSEVRKLVRNAGCRPPAQEACA